MLINKNDMSANVCTMSFDSDSNFSESRLWQIFHLTLSRIAQSILRSISLLAVLLDNLLLSSFYYALPVALKAIFILSH